MSLLGNYKLDLPKADDKNLTGFSFDINKQKNTGPWSDFYDGVPTIGLAPEYKYIDNSVFDDMLELINDINVKASKYVDINTNNIIKDINDLILLFDNLSEIRRRVYVDHLENSDYFKSNVLPMLNAVGNFININISERFKSINENIFNTVTASYNNSYNSGLQKLTKEVKDKYNTLVLITEYLRGRTDMLTTTYAKNLLSFYEDMKNKFLVLNNKYLGNTPEAAYLKQKAEAINFDLSKYEVTNGVYLSREINELKSLLARTNALEAEIKTNRLNVGIKYDGMISFIDKARNSISEYSAERTTLLKNKIDETAIIIDNRIKSINMDSLEEVKAAILFFTNERNKISVGDDEYEFIIVYNTFINELTNKHALLVQDLGSTEEEPVAPENDSIVNNVNIPDVDTRDLATTSANGPSDIPPPADDIPPPADDIPPPADDTPKNDGNTETDSSISITTIIIIILAIVIVLVASYFGWKYIKNRRRKKEQQSDLSEPIIPPTNTD